MVAEPTQSSKRKSPAANEPDWKELYLMARATKRPKLGAWKGKAFDSNEDVEEWLKKFNQITMLETDNFRNWNSVQIVCYFLSALIGPAKECINLYITRPNIDASLDRLKRTLRNRFIDKN